MVTIFYLKNPNTGATAGVIASTPDDAARILGWQLFTIEGRTMVDGFVIEKKEEDK